jgi:Kazal-type serine protease inhibitor domain
MTRLATTPVILGTFVGGMVAAGLLAGCSSKQVEIGSQNMDAHALDAPAGSGGAAGAGIDAAVAGRGGGTGGVTGAGGAGPGGGTVGSGGAGGIGGVGGTAGTGGASSTGKTCGGFVGLPCAAGEICETPPGHCCCDYSGTCAVKPQVCAMIYQPVCGCDGTTYSNDCERQLSGVSKDFDGACPTADAGTGGSTRTGGATGAGGTTGTGGATETGGSTRTGGTTGTGTGCAPDWTLCCGQCLSPLAGVCQTPCPAGGGGATGGSTGAGGAGGSIGATCAGERGESCLAANQLCDLDPGYCGSSDGGGLCVAKPQACSDIYQPVCGCNGATYPSDCVRQLAGVSKDHDGACGASTTCGGIAGASCATGQFCEMPAGSCNVSDTTGTCVVQHTNCLTNSQPECGCDGKTYRNSCYREAAGVSKKSDGACPTADGGADGSAGKTCGGIAGVGCATGEFCDLLSGSCSVADATGTCVVNVGVGCITIYQPVCGCDGKTYPSDCDRQVAGVSKESDGVCPTGDASTGSCSQVTTQAECDSRSDCHSVFMDLGTCGCAAAGCCEHFNRCADGGRANCNAPVQFGCTIAQPSCGGAYVMSYTSNCYEGCVLQSECAGVDGGALRD